VQIIVPGTNAIGYVFPKVICRCNCSIPVHYDCRVAYPTQLGRSSSVSGGPARYGIPGSAKRSSSRSGPNRTLPTLVGPSPQRSSIVTFCILSVDRFRITPSGSSIKCSSSETGPSGALSYGHDGRKIPVTRRMHRNARKQDRPYGLRQRNISLKILEPKPLNPKQGRRRTS